MEPMRAFWHWNESAMSIDKVIALTKETGGNTIILKAGYQEPPYSTNFRCRLDFPASAKKVKAAGLMLGAEVYCVPGSWAAEGDCLRAAMKEHGACFAVLNMEGPYEAETTESNARKLLVQVGSPKRTWVCSDWRGDRLLLPYHKGLAPFIAGWMPMVYPGAFYPDTPWGDLQRAFDDIYWSWIRHSGQLHHNAREIPILPAIQSYNGMDYEEMVGQIVLAWRWTKVLNKATHGTSIYVAHDCNVRAKWGARDGWEIVQDAIRQAEEQNLDWEELADSVATTVRRVSGNAAYDAIQQFAKE